jgi:hypothetical protein
MLYIPQVVINKKPNQDFERKEKTMTELILCMGLTTFGLALSEVKFLGDKWKKLFRLIGVISALIFIYLVISDWTEYSPGRTSALVLMIWFVFYGRLGKTKKGLILYLTVFTILLLTSVMLIVIGWQYNSNINTDVNISFVESRELYISDDTPVVRTKDSYEYSYIKNGKKESDSASRRLTKYGYVNEGERYHIDKYLITYTKINNNVNPPAVLGETKEDQYLIFIPPGSLLIDE